MNRSRVKKVILSRLKLLLGLVALFMVLIGGYYLRTKKSDYYYIATSNGGNDYLKAGLNPETSTQILPVKEDIPTSFLITNFPFQTQAPQSNWDGLHEEACEEASVTLVNYYLNDRVITPELMEQEIQNLIQWESINFNGAIDINVAQLGQLAKASFGFNYKVINASNIAELKNQIAAGHPVIIPAAGRLLGNPNFQSPGPVYHMVVAIGYTSKDIIVQDVGTRNGSQYVYNQNIFSNAWHDFVVNEPIENGQKNMLVLSK